MMVFDWRSQIMFFISHWLVFCLLLDFIYKAIGHHSSSIDVDKNNCLSGGDLDQLKLLFPSKKIESFCSKCSDWERQYQEGFSGSEKISILTANAQRWVKPLWVCRDLDCVCKFRKSGCSTILGRDRNITAGHSSSRSRTEDYVKVSVAENNSIGHHERKKRADGTIINTPLIFSKVKRKEIRMLTDLERKKLFDAINKLKNSKIDGDMNRYDTLISYHVPERAVTAHFCPSFFPFHREFLKVTEFALREIDPDISIPYWDMTMDALLPDPRDSILWTEEFLGTGTGQVTNGPFALWKPWPDASAPAKLQVEHLIRNVGMESLGELVKGWQVERILKMKQFEELTFCNSRFVEMIHGFAHMWVGGHMVEFRTAPNDPLFFFFHAFFDRIWEQWRHLRQTRDQRETQYADGSCMAHCSKSMFEPLMPFPTTEYEALSNWYTDSLYDYEPPPTCDVKHLDCGSRYLFCDQRKYLCAPKVKLGGNCTGFEYYQMTDVCFKSVCSPKGTCIEKEPDLVIEGTKATRKTPNFVFPSVSRTTNATTISSASLSSSGATTTAPLPTTTTMAKTTTARTEPITTTTTEATTTTVPITTTTTRTVPITTTTTEATTTTPTPTTKATVTPTTTTTTISTTTTTSARGNGILLKASIAVAAPRISGNENLLSEASSSTSSSKATATISEKTSETTMWRSEFPKNIATGVPHNKMKHMLPLEASTTPKSTSKKVAKSIQQITLKTSTEIAKMTTTTAADSSSIFSVIILSFNDDKNEIAPFDSALLSLKMFMDNAIIDFRGRKIRNRKTQQIKYFLEFVNPASLGLHPNAVSLQAFDRKGNCDGFCKDNGSGNGYKLCSNTAEAVKVEENQGIKIDFKKIDAGVFTASSDSFVFLCKVDGNGLITGLRRSDKDKREQWTVVDNVVPTTNRSSFVIPDLPSTTTKKTSVAATKSSSSSSTSTTTLSTKITSISATTDYYSPSFSPSVDDATPVIEGFSGNIAKRQSVLSASHAAASPTAATITAEVTADSMPSWRPEEFTFPTFSITGNTKEALVTPSTSAPPLDQPPGHIPETTVASARNAEVPVHRPKAIVMPSSLNFFPVKSQPQVETSKQLECKNFDEDCDYWASESECEANPAWMHKFCALACNQCDKALL